MQEDEIINLSYQKYPLVDSGNSGTIKGSLNSGDCIMDFYKKERIGFTEGLKSANETITLLENRLKGFKLHYCVDEIKEENRRLNLEISKAVYLVKKLDKWSYSCNDDSYPTQEVNDFLKLDKN